jgi:phosphoglycerate dehydrogenase-like enzyme
MGQAARRLELVGTDVIVTTASGVHAAPLTEFVFAALLDRAKRLDDLKAWQREHRWQRFTGGELAGQTMAIVGPGRIGSRIARVAKAFEMTVWALGRRYEPERAAELGVDRLFPPDGLLEMLGGADVVVLIAPHTDETERLIGERELAAMRPGATVVNIARGAVVDEAALVAALRSGQLGYAVLDVFETEPLPPDSPFWELPNVLVSPHCSANAPSENRKITDLFIHNLRRWADGRIDEMHPVLDMERLY